MDQDGIARADPCGTKRTGPRTGSCGIKLTGPRTGSCGSKRKEGECRVETLHKKGWVPGIGSSRQGFGGLTS